MKLYLGLVHYPVRNKRGEVVTTSVTNLDIHDLSRLAATFGLKKFFIVTPLQKQHKLLEKILGHWKGDKASAYNPDRYQALKSVELSESWEQALETIEKYEGVRPLVVTTSALPGGEGEVSDLLCKINLDKQPLFLLFGTGWGLTDEVLEKADFRLAPINGPTDYNHLSVRSAVSIYLDRFNTWEEKT